MSELPKTFDPTAIEQAQTLDRIRRESHRDAKHQAALMIHDDSPHEPTGAVDDDRLRPCEDGLAGRVLEVFFEEHPRARRPAGTGQGAARSPTSTA